MYLPVIDILGWIPALAIKSTFGQINTNEQTNVPLSERFRPGGISCDGQIRGYPDYSIGPRTGGGYTSGGFTMFITTAEMSFPIVKQQIYAVAFADAGNAWRDIEKMDLNDLNRSTGFGVRFILPLAGIIGLDFAYGFDRQSYQGGKQWETHFQFGQTLF
jgi:outer membrane protein insertion porin family